MFIKVHEENYVAWRGVKYVYINIAKVLLKR